MPGLRTWGGFENVRNVPCDGGFLILLAHRDESAYEGPVDSFEAYLRQMGIDPSDPGIPYRKCVGGEEIAVEGKQVYLLGRPRNSKGYARELSNAGFRIEHRSIFGRNRHNVAFVLTKVI